MLSREYLLRIKTRALRQKVWFNVTSRLDRDVFDLTINCVERIRSPVLVRIISGIIGKILKTLENRFLNKVQIVGTKIAKNVCRVALKWKNLTASSWKHDSDFIRFLGVNALNKNRFGGRIH